MDACGIPIAPYDTLFTDNAGICRTRQFPQHLHDTVRLFADGIETEQHGRFQPQFAFHGAGNMDTPFHKIEGKIFYFLYQFLTHSLPALPSHELGGDFQKPPPYFSRACHGNHIVTGNKREVSPLKKKERFSFPSGAEITLSVNFFRMGQRHHIEPVHGKTEIGRPVEAEPDILIFHETHTGGFFQNCFFSVYKPGKRVNTAAVAFCNERKPEGQFLFTAVPSPRRKYPVPFFS